ncbi:MAG: T9SS type A sorting domain-containing protein [Bacteroidia bacterium]|nr:T9SS type A sorting domain-containing protein [Bacteroidia bacterium]
MKHRFFIYFTLMLFTKITIGQTYTVVVGASTSTTSGYASPYQNNYDNARKQYVITTGEMYGAGSPRGGLITAVGFNGQANGGNRTINLTIGIKTTATSMWLDPDLNLAASWETGFTNIYNNNINGNNISGWKYYSGAGTFCWDGSSNLLLNVSNTGGLSGTTAPRVYVTSTRSSPCTNTLKYAYGSTACCGNGSGTGATYVPPTSQIYDNWGARPQTAIVITVNGACPANGSLPTGTTALCQVLSAGLVNFSATANDDKVTFDWITSSEINTNEFIIERSSDGESFEPITNVKAAGNSSRNLKYNAVDVTPLLGLSYYRLKQIDNDGSYVYTDPVYVQFDGTKNIVVNNFHPNPTDSNIDFDVYSPLNGPLQIEIIDYTGKVVSYNTQHIEKGKTIINTKMDELSDGIYFLKVTFEKTGFSSIGKVIRN